MVNEWYNIVCEWTNKWQNETNTTRLGIKEENLLLCTKQEKAFDTIDTIVRWIYSLLS